MKLGDGSGGGFGVNGTRVSLIKGQKMFHGGVYPEFVELTRTCVLGDDDDVLVIDLEKFGDGYGKECIVNYEPQEEGFLWIHRVLDENQNQTSTLNSVDKLRMCPESENNGAFNLFLTVTCNRVWKTEVIIQGRVQIEDSSNPGISPWLLTGIALAIVLFFSIIFCIRGKFRMEKAGNSSKGLSQHDEIDSV